MFKKEEIKILWKYFLFLFLLTAFIINFNSLSWLFNYKIISGAIKDFFQKNQIFQESNQLKKEGNFQYSEKENSLEIPKIGIFAPLIFPEEDSKEKEIAKLLDYGVVHLPKSALPGENGQTIILGHSAPPGWPKVKYDWIFSQINKLDTGDEIFIYFEQGKYNFKVVKKVFLEKGEELPQDLTKSENSLVLISCWPPGKDLRRIAVLAQSSL